MAYKEVVVRKTEYGTNNVLSILFEYSDASEIAVFPIENGMIPINAIDRIKYAFDMGWKVSFDWEGRW